MTENSTIDPIHQVQPVNPIEQAEALFLKGDFPGAEAALKLALQSKPGNLEFIIALGNIQLKQNKMDEAERTFENAANSSPNYFPAFTNLAAVQIMKGKLDAAKTCIQYVLNIDPRNQEAIQLWGFISTKEKEKANTAVITSPSNSLTADEQMLIEKSSIPIQDRKSYVNATFPQYHLSILESLHEKYSLKNKVVIDIGGSNIPVEVMQSFGVKKFVCLDPVTKWGHPVESHTCFGKPIYKLADFSAAFDREFSFILDEDVEDINETMSGLFDVAISISTFEHVTSLRQTMQQIYNLLSAEGFLHSQYEPVFSCAAGHHVYLGENINFNNTPEINYFHLLYSKEEAMEILRKVTRFNQEQRNAIIRQLYDSQKINRFYLTQHINAICTSPFNRYVLEYFFLQPVPQEIQQKLIQKYGNERFDVRGVKVTAFKK